MAEKRKTRQPAGKRSSPSSARAEKLENARRQREITGVVLIASGCLLGIYLFISASGVLGEALSRALFGLAGFIAYVLPIILIALGWLSIRGSRRPHFTGSFWFVILGVLAIIALMQVARNDPYENVRYMDYLNGAFKAGTLPPHRGGGFIGGVLAYPILMLGGKALAYSVLICCIVVSVIAVTGFSISDMQTRLTDTVQTAVTKSREVREEREAVRQEERRLYMANLSDEPDPLAAKPRQSARPAAKKAAAKRVMDLDDALTFLPTGGTLKTSKRGDDTPPWDEEPAVDEPLIIEKVPGKSRKKAAEPSPADTEALFGSAPARPKRTLRPDAPPLAPNEPLLSESAPKKPIRPRVTELTPAEPIVVPESPAEPPAYQPPSFSLLNAPDINFSSGRDNTAETAKLLVDTLANFNISAKVTNVCVGPVLTSYELLPAPGVRISRITGLSNDIALALAAQRVRIEAPIPGKSAIGIEIPNKSAIRVVLRDIVESRAFMGASSPVTLALGKDVSGKVVTADLAKMPHMLIAGSTGSGKSVCINGLIISMVYKSSPADLKLILVDPKMVELSVFGTLPHLLIPVVTDPKKASGALRWAVNEMTQRYKKFTEKGARDLDRYNELQETPATRLPKLVVIIDELADLMMVAPDEVEDSICRIAQLGRAAGIHLIVATQRPSADIITGLIKANIPSRCAFAVSSAIDSRIILDCAGAEKLIGRGDMLFHANGANKPIRLQGAFVSDEEVERIVNYFKVQERSVAFDQALVDEVTSAAKGGATGGVFGEGKQEDELLGEGVRIVLESGQASISMIQRRLRVGYARAARLIDIMEQHGYVSGFEGSKPRRVLIKRSQFEEEFGEPFSAADAPEEGPNA